MKPELYDPINELVIEIVNASEVNDQQAQWAAYQALKALCERSEENGNHHPFQWETLGDFTHNKLLALGFYEKALSYASALALDEYIASICFAMAETHVALGNISAAKCLATQANEAAIKTDDLELRRSVSELLLETSSRT
ncbi:hypothetical protein SAMN05216214_114116 [Atopomonas hussainii]|uniref:Tetratricopeptide repeat protein n=1 Tax=Atopomonas hussainii TaxID=1429083 RepID=A0A1H7REJ7_9GAMM|nr:hypothetical protein [Atopomonas hussainii]SEL58603.1 hypothetical protein SAMN05216214_114116 [Atopomonas hussainii]